MNKKKLFSILLLLFVFIFTNCIEITSFSSLSFVNKVYAESYSTTINFAESTSRNASQTITIPNLQSITSITVNTGRVTYSVNGNKVTVSVSNGNVTSSSTPSRAQGYTMKSSTNSFPATYRYNDGTYSGTLNKSGGSIGTLISPQDKKTVTASWNNTVTSYGTYSPSATTSSSQSNPAPTTYSYNSGGYSGYLPRVSTTTVSDTGRVKKGTNTWSRVAVYRANYRGTVTKPAVYSYSQNYNGTVYGSTVNLYAYTVTINYLLTPLTPSVTLTSPNNGATCQLGSSIRIAATGTNCDHMNAFVNGSAMFTTQNGNSYSYNYTPTAAGTYRICVKGRNTANSTDPGSVLASSSTATITVISPPPAPTVTLTSPNNGETCQLGSSIRIAATGTNCNHMNAFINGSAMFATQNGNSFSYDYTPTAAGTYAICVKGSNTASSTDPGSVLASSSTVNVEVTAEPEPLPDLVITDITYTPEDIKADDAVVFSAIVKNEGQVASPSGLALRVGFMVDGSTPTLWSDDYESSIEPGETITVTATKGLDGPNYIATSGNHIVTAVVDDLGAINESKEDNNSRNKAISVEEKADESVLYYVVMDDCNGNPVELYLSDIGGSAAENDDDIYAIVKTDGNALWERYEMCGDAWIDTCIAYENSPAECSAVTPSSVKLQSQDINGDVSYVIDDSPKIVKIDIASKKNEILKKFYKKVEINPSELTVEDIECIGLGIVNSIDDNIIFGFVTWLNENMFSRVPPDDNYYYIRSKTFCDSVFVSAFAVATVGTAAEAARALSTAGLAGGLGLATSPSGAGLVICGTAAVAELAEAGAMAGVSFVSGVLAKRSQNIFRNDLNKLNEAIKLKAVAEATERFLKNIKARNIINKTADEANDWWRTAKGYTDPPYTPGSIVLEFELDEPTKFVRVYDDINSSMKGQWFMKAEDIGGLTPKQIQNKFALPTEPKYVVDLELPAGTKIRTGEANSLYGFTGKGVQFDAMGQYLDGWVNPRLLP